MEISIPIIISHVISHCKSKPSGQQFPSSAMNLMKTFDYFLTRALTNGPNLSERNGSD